MEKMPIDRESAGSDLTPPLFLRKVGAWLKYGLLGDEAEAGQGLMEYALVLFFIAVVVIAVLIILGPQIGSMFSAVTKGFS
jgi:pilus assembly protein Flp/PilA